MSGLGLIYAHQSIDFDKELLGDQSSGEELESENRVHKINLWDLEDFSTENHEKLDSRRDDYDKCSRITASDSSVELASGLSSVSAEPDSLSAHKYQHPVQEFMARDTDNNSRESEFLKMQEANNIFKAAFKEIMALASEANTWVVGTPALGSIEEFQQMFRRPPPTGMGVECSIATAIVPIDLKSLLYFFMDVDRWASTLSEIVYCGSSHSPTGVLSELIHVDQTITEILVVNAEFQLPTPLVPTRKFCFLRCLRRIIPDIWAIVDVSTDYFHHEPSDPTLEVKCVRRPSGIIIRGCEQCSEVIWIENVEVHQALENMYAEVVNSNLAFGAKRWVRTLLRKSVRSNSNFINLKLPLGIRAHAYVLNLTKCMEKEFFECINGAPNRKWDIMADTGIRVLRAVNVNHVETQSLSCYSGSTSFHVQAAPLSVFHFLVKKNLDMQWPSLLEEPEELFKFVTEDGCNCTTLHRKVGPQNHSPKDHEYLLQEAWRDEFCHFIISSPMTLPAVAAAFYSGEWRYDFLKPSGFAIMPDGSVGLRSDASLVTIAVRQELYVQETSQAIDAISSIVRGIVREITEAMATGGEASR